MTDSNSPNNDNRWVCKFCHKSYSHNYPFKKHLQKCLVHTSKSEHEQTIMRELKAELKEQFTHMFQQALNDMKIDMRTTFQNVQPAKRYFSAF